MTTVSGNKPTDSFLAYIAFLLVPVLTAYVMILVHIEPMRKNTHYVSALWMGIGGLAYAIYGKD